MVYLFCWYFLFIIDREVAPQVMRYQGNKQDYTYSKPVLGWYKVHYIPRTWIVARSICMQESTLLAAPVSYSMKHEFPTWIEKVKSSMIHTGYSDNLSRGIFISEEGVSVWNSTFITWEGDEPNGQGDERCLIMYKNGNLADESCDLHLPFVCFMPYVYQYTYLYAGCKTIDANYIYRKTGCYKLTANTETWYEAMRVCEGDGGTLAIINSHKEMKVLKAMFKKFKSTLTYPGYNLAVFLGFHNQIADVGWITLEGDKIEDSGYDVWASEREGNHPPGPGDCGSMNVYGEYISMNCTAKLPFFCERIRYQWYWMYSYY